MKICAAQFAPIAGGIEDNVDQHIVLIKAAMQNHADVIFFPELSLSGYEPTLAKRLAITKEDPRLQVLQQLSDAHGISIAVGAPLKTAFLPTISMLIFQRGMPVTEYHKQLLHKDELPFFSAGEKLTVINAQTENLVPAICYESLQPSHLQCAIENNVTTYLASVAKTSQNVKDANGYFSAVAKNKGINVLMANCYGLCDSFHAAGQSAAWLKNSAETISLGADESGLVGIDTRESSLFSAKVKM